LLSEQAEKMDSFLYSLTSALTFAQIKSKTVEYFKTMSKAELMRASRLSETKTAENPSIDHYAGAATEFPSPSLSAVGSSKYTTGYKDDVLCFGCGGRGHIQKDCPNPVLQTAEGGKFKMDRKCYKCGESGHLMQDCPQSARNSRHVHTGEPSRSTNPATEIGKKRPNPYVQVRGYDGNLKTFRTDRTQTVQLACLSGVRRPVKVTAS
jgi:hypothetical protein